MKRETGTAPHPATNVAPTASLNPANARHDAAPPRLGEMRIEQVDRPPLVLHELHVPCACGRPLVGQEYRVIGDTVFVWGVCLQCGNQQAIFAPPQKEETVDEHVARIEDDVRRYVAGVLALRAKLEAAEIEEATLELVQRSA